MAYIKGENKPGGPGADEGCPFDHVQELPDADGLIVARGTLVFAVLNLYPYNSGHLLVCPNRHVADYTDLDEAETAELASFTKIAMRVLRAVSGAQGFNIGMNMGDVAGAGIAAHLHQHVVPAGAATPTSCRSSPRPKSCPSSCPKPATSSPRPGRKGSDLRPGRRAVRAQGCF